MVRVRPDRLLRELNMTCTRLEPSECSGIAETGGISTGAH